MVSSGEFSMTAMGGKSLNLNIGNSHSKKPDCLKEKWHTGGLNERGKSDGHLVYLDLLSEKC